MIAQANVRKAAQELAGLAPTTWFYLRLQEGLAFYRALEREVPYQPVPAERTLRLGDEHDNVRLLRKHLQHIGLLDASEGDPRFFDEEMRRPLRGFRSSVAGLNWRGLSPTRTTSTLPAIR